MKKGFSLIEIIVSLAILGIVFSFVFYFVSSINLRSKKIDEKPYLVSEYNYSDKYCYFANGQVSNLAIVQDINISSFISTSTVITSMSVLAGNTLIITTNSASTTEPDIFVFSLVLSGNILTSSLIQSLDVGPGAMDALLHDTHLYVLNSSVNSHVKTFGIGTDKKLSQQGDIKILELTTSHALPKRIYLHDKKIIVGTEKNNYGGELFILPLDQNAIPTYPTKSLEIGGQVSGLYAGDGLLQVANASDTELFVYNNDFNLAYLYDAPLSLGNGKSVYYLKPYIYLGRTVAGFELFFLKVGDHVLDFVNKYKISSTVDFIQNVDQLILIISNSQNKELQFFSKDMSLVKVVDLPSRVEAYTCLENGLLSAHLINNQSHLLWLK